MTPGGVTPERPATVTGATWLSVGVVAMTGLTALMTLVFEGELVDAWAAHNSGSVEPPAFGPVAVTLSVVVALLTVVLLWFFRGGHEWARVVMSVVAALVAVATLAILRSNPPALFWAVAVVSLVVDAAAVAALWHPATRAYCRHRPVAATDGS
ncbi:hypothetical protein [Nocardioides sp.]|uniref:hypothetical protein n=1 Tax=Nocardioides sp. TaxID=35761 RepID=UPI003783301A